MSCSVVLESRQRYFFYTRFKPIPAAPVIVEDFVVGQAWVIIYAPYVEFSRTAYGWPNQGFPYTCHHLPAVLYMSQVRFELGEAERMCASSSQATYGAHGPNVRGNGLPLSPGLFSRRTSCVTHSGDARLLRSVTRSRCIGDFREVPHS